LYQLIPRLKGNVNAKLLPRRANGWNFAIAETILDGMLS